MMNPSLKKLYYFRWQGNPGGGNSVWAANKREALKLATEMGKPTEYKPGKMTCGLTPVPESFTTNKKKQAAMDAEWDSLCR